MTPMKRFLLYILLLLPAAGHTCGREFRQFTTEDGLSDNAVLNLYQDEYGMIWAGTRNGLNQYNGNGFKVYKYRKGDRDGIQDNHIRGITGNRDGKIFIITFGISELDIKTGIFRTITEKETNAIFWHGALYAGIGRKVLKYDGEKFEEICEIPDEALGITSLGVDDEFMLIGTEAHGLYLYDSKSAPVNIIRHDRISSVFHDRNGRWWVGTWHNGAYIIDGNSIRNIRSSDSASSGLSSDFVRSFCQDVNGDIWIGTFNGINVCNPETMEFTMYTDNNAAAGYSSVWSLLCDIQGNIWAGTYFDGIYLYPEDEDVFRHWKKSQDESTGLRSNMVREFIEDRYGNLWIATDGGGLGMLDKKRQTFRWYSHDSPAGSVTHDNITSLYYDDISDRLWIGTHLGGLNCMDIETGKFTYYHGYENDSFVNSDVIRDVERFNDRLLIITDKGISVSDPATGMSEPLFADNRELINDAKGCTVDSDGNVWIYGGGFGIYVWNPDNDEFRRYSSEPGTPHGICSNSVNKVFQDSKGRIWLCNRKDGIDLYDPQTDGFTNIDEAHNSLADNCVYNVAELPSGRLVFTTDSGFSILNDTTFTFTNYDRGNGVPLSAINEKILELRKTRAESEREKNECLREIKEIMASVAAKEKETIAAMAKADERLERLSKGIRRLPMEIANFDDSFVPLKALSGIEYKKIVGCYLIHNRENDRYYVGQSKDVMKRLKQHFRGTVPNNVIFAQDYYSSEYEHKEDLFEVKIVPCSTKDELDRKEREYIRRYDANGSGYNSTSGNK